jgi:hypothetical protein
MRLGRLVADREDAAAPARHRVEIYAEPRDIWVGVFVSPAAVYVCPVPMLVIRWQRGRAR